MVKAIPEGYHTITPYLVADDADKLIEFLKNAFNADINECMRGGDGKICHAELKIGDSKLMVGGKPGQPMSSAMLYLYVEDTDALYHQAIAAGGKSILEPMDQFYGDRNSGVQDPCGNQWWIATHVEDLSIEELEKRAKQQGK